MKMKNLNWKKKENLLVTDKRNMSSCKKKKIAWHWLIKETNRKKALLYIYVYVYTYKGIYMYKIVSPKEFCALKSKIKNISDCVGKEFLFILLNSLIDCFIGFDNNDCSEIFLFNFNLNLLLLLRNTVGVSSSL